jgi:hypothetical protein
VALKPSRLRDLALAAVLLSVVISFPQSVLYDWAAEIAARNECKSFKCLAAKWYLFEAQCGVPQAVLEEMKQSKRWEEYAKTTRDCDHPSELYGWEGKRVTPR